ncbi:MAG TPA: DUF5063 domain-containing protein [Anaerolineae bacterium]|nr:DUF5063 domain-containing protein [Anaerolineae bacterium]
MSKGERTEQFVVVARQFCEWAISNYPAGLQSAKQALELITELYLCGIRLINEVQEVEAPEPTIESRGNMRSTVLARARNLPLNYYSEVFNPIPVPAEEPVTGDLADDIADIYEDIARGLRLLDAGYREHAVWNWVFNMQAHWGEHATSAIRVLHWFLSEQHVFM